MVVPYSELIRAVEDWMDVQGRCRRSSAQFAESKDEFLLELIGEIILFAEEYNASLADYPVVKRISIRAYDLAFVQEAHAYW